MTTTTRTLKPYHKPTIRRETVRAEDLLNQIDRAAERHIDELCRRNPNM